MAIELPLGVGNLLLVRHAVVPVVVVLHERHALALHGVRDERDRLAGAVRDILHRTGGRAHVVVRAPWGEQDPRDLGFVRFERGDVFTEDAIVAASPRPERR